MLRKVAFIALRVFLFVWLFLAMITFFDLDFMPEAPVETAFVQRAIQALKSAFVDIPSVLGFVAGALSGPAEAVRQEFSGEIYAVADASTDAVDDARAWASEMVSDAWRKVILPMSVVQFTTLFVLRGFGAGLLWGGFASVIPRVENIPAKVLSWVIFGVFAYVIAMRSYAEGGWTLATTAIALPLVLLYPVMAGLPLWFLMTVLKIDPCNLFRASASYRQRRKTDAADGKQKPPVAAPTIRTETVRPEPAKPAPPIWNNPNEEPQGPEPAPRVFSYDEACAMFGLSPNGFTEAELRTRYRELMKLARGAPWGGMQKSSDVNVAYEAILSAQGWQR